MKRMTGEEIRRTWISFFESKGHRYIPGVSLIPQGDKSLLWVNAGVTGLKKYFDGSEIPPSRRIVNVQKSIRTNDIENVGHTARHHTFFEMLGNFSIGDYFRNEVIPWGYELLTSEDVGFGFDPNKLYVTYNPMDKATFALWVKCGISPDHLIPLEDNFWQIGEGPSGPDTEIFYDRGEKYDPEGLGIEMLRKDIENDRYIEIWNIVFSQYNAVNGVPRSEFKELPSKNIDTGSGLERLACILQGTETNFETDLFMPIIKEVERMSGKPYEGENLMAFRVIADHARCLAFALSDGALFANEGRGYVLRRIIRRAMRYGQKLGLNEPFMHRLIGLVAECYAGFYPDLLKHVATVSKMVLAEENKFLKTLVSGEAMLREAMKDKKVLSGEDVFRLYDTFGFPSDLTQDIASEEGVACDMEGFAKLMEAQRSRARLARGEIESFHKQSKDLLAFKEKSEFSYDELALETKVIGLFKDGVRVPSLDEEGDVILERTPFYAEMGGQVSDGGVLKGEDCLANVVSVGKAPSSQHLHHVLIRFGTLKEGDAIKAEVDAVKRHATERNHSATHLLHAALSNVLGTHVDQKGSYVDSEYLRFDYSAEAKLSDEQKARIEEEVNEKIAEGIEEETLVLPLEEAQKIGAEMEFSEKYGSTVRVVAFGDYSKEFCGGTHVKNTADIGFFALCSDEAVSSGVRRIEAVTSLGAYHYLSNKTRLLEEVKRKLDASEKDLLRRLGALKEEDAALKKEKDELKAKVSSYEAKALSSQVKRFGVTDVIYLRKKGAKREDLMLLGDSLKVNRSDYLIVLVGGEDGDHPLIVMAKGEGARRVGAGRLVKALASSLGGGGGGKDEMASGKLLKADGLEEALAPYEKALQ